MVPSEVARMMNPNAAVIGMLQLILLVMSQFAQVPEVERLSRSAMEVIDVWMLPCALCVG